MGVKLLHVEGDEKRPQSKAAAGLNVKTPV
jgi:hypothetical protein